MPSSTKTLLSQLSPNSIGIDYCDPIKTKSILSEGYKFVCRYINPTDPHFSTQLSKSEYRDLTKAGLPVVLIWESSAKRALEGKSAGIADAEYAKKFCARMGLTEPVFFTVDCDVRGAELNKVSAYFEGVKSVIPQDKIGVYGGLKVVKHCLDNQLADAAWQTFAWSGGSHDKHEDARTVWDPRAKIQQTRIDSDDLDGVGIDINRLVK